MQVIYLTNVFTGFRRATSLPLPGLTSALHRRLPVGEGPVLNTFTILPIDAAQG